ncbi:MAG TPA: L-glyceraldehyde 3-phosphate reductase [Bacteroidales bacterium]|nr:L-glyceraldehyde 3-phosphate reductase [Bacteroidales bacterium]
MNYIANPSRYDKMKYNQTGRSGMLLPAISLGLWHNFGAIDNFETGRQIILRAFDAGITHFDLANNYGPPPGSAEEFMGKVLQKDLASYRDELIVSTKAGYTMWPGPYGDGSSRKYLLSSLDQSLRRMKVDYVDIFYSHRYDPNTPLEETMMALSHAVKQGKALYAGVSNYGMEQTAQAAELLRQLGTPCLIHQPKYSMFERWVEKGLLNTLDHYGIGCIAFSPLAQGLLTDRYLHGIPSESRAGKPTGFLRPEQVTVEKIQIIKKLNELARNRGQTLAQMAIAWLLKDRRVTSVLIGASSPDQLIQNIGALENLYFDEWELKQIAGIIGN